MDKIIFLGCLFYLIAFVGFIVNSILNHFNKWGKQKMYETFLLVYTSVLVIAIILIFGGLLLA